MPKAYWDAEKLNKHLQQIEDAGYSLPTQTYRIQAGRTNIVISNELKNAGYVRSYDEAVDFMKRAYGDRYQTYTLEEYEKDLRSLQDALGGERSYQGEIRAQRSRLNDIVYDMNDYLDTSYNPKELTTKELYDAVKQANEMVKESNAKSPMFYEYLADILEGKSSEV